MDELVDQILEELESLGAWLYHQTPDSVYIKFEDSGLGSLRISNHEGRPLYRYKWNLRYDFILPMVKQHGNVTRRYYPVENVADFFRDIEQAST